MTPLNCVRDTANERPSPPGGGPPATHPAQAAGGGLLNQSNECTYIDNTWAIHPHHVDM
jgi:hypothetical protein